MNDDELVGLLQRGIDRRVRSVSPPPNVEGLLTRLEHRVAHQRRLLAAALVGALFVGAGIVYGIVVSTGRSTASPSVSAFGAGVPVSQGSGPSFEPRDANAARVAVAGAFHAGFDGGVSYRTRDAATQDAESLRIPRRDAEQFALGHGYTDEQLAGIRIAVLDTSFIDATHAVVRFSLMIPGHGVVLGDRVGYAIRGSGRWRVALRTSCDILSITGLWSQCPPAS